MGKKGQIKRTFFFIAFTSMLLSVFATSGQVDKANEYYENYQLSRAVELYKKVVKKEPNNFVALKRLGIASLKLNRYEEAEMFLGRAYKQKEVDEETMLAYGRALKQNKKLNEAKDVFSALSKRNPEIGKRFVLAVKQISKWEEEDKGYQVEAISSINTADAEFSAYKLKDAIVFVSERNKDYVNYTESEINEQPYLAVYIAEKKGNGYKKPKLFHSNINGQQHSGPIVFSGDGNTAYFTQVVQTKTTAAKVIVSRPQIFIAQRDDKNWDKPVPFKHNNENYSLAHPSISDDGKKLYFTSDMPGGHGGKDIYVSENTGSGWGEPKNLGPEINTDQDESFPYIHSDGTLYFSSDGHIGYGGLDIFASTQTGGKWADPVNQKSPLNSAGDDFGISFSDEEKGWLSSNRIGGQGSDDIYSFEKQIIRKDIPSTTITGILEYNKLPSDQAAIWLSDENDVDLISVVPGEDGTFMFEKLEPDKTYYLSIKDFDGDIDLASIFLTNDKGEKVIKLVKTGDNKYFAFQALPRDEYNALPLLIEEDESLLNISVYGRVYEKIPGDAPMGIKVNIVDEDGNLRFSTTADEDGMFKFDRLPPDQAYLLQLAEKDANLKMLILSEKGEMVKSLKKTKNTFKYERIDPDEAMITLLDENDVVLRIKEDENFTIGNIYYDYDSWKINDGAKAELEKLSIILKKNPHIGMELSSHTDSRSSDKYNLDLSQKRAKAAEEYIISTGVDKKQIIGKGYGESKLVNKCADDVECSEEEHAKNRRTEFRVYNRK